MSLRSCLLLLLVMWSSPAMAQGSAARVDRMAYLATALDRWAIDIPIAVTMLEDPYPEVRAGVVRVLAATTDESSIPLLVRYAADSEPSVRREVMLAAGRIGPRGLELAVGGLGDRSPMVRQAAAWALCHAGSAGWGPLLALLKTEKNIGVLETALANVWRFEDEAWQPQVALYAIHASPYLRRAAAYSLSRTGESSARPAQRRLMEDQQPVIRATVIRGFARGSLAPKDLEVLVSALEDPDWRVRAAACGVLAARDAVALSEESATRIASFFSSPHPHLASAAVAAAAAQPSVGSNAQFEAILEGDEPSLAARALAVVARRDATNGAEIAALWAAEGSETWRRRAAASVAPTLGKDAEDRAISDAVPGVRLAWLSGLENEQVVERKKRLLALLKTDPDAAVRAQTLSLLREADAAPPVEELIALHTKWKRDTMPDARVEAIAAALAASDAGPERSAILKVGLQDVDPAAVAMVVNSARGLGETVAFPPRESRHGGLWFKELLSWVAEERWLDVVTERGTFRIELDLESAPLTSREIWDLAADGFYDGLDFHRVVPNFVVQGGDPRGDGWGGPGFALADEASMKPFDSWRVGVATSGPQTGGCQLFVTLLPADHLTGHYTNIGEVVAGREVLTEIRVGDLIREIKVHSGTTPPPLASSAE